MDLLQQILSDNANTIANETYTSVNEAGNKISDKFRQISFLLSSTDGMRHECDKMAKLVDDCSGYLPPAGEQLLRETVIKLKETATAQPRILPLLAEMRAELQRYLL